MKILRLKNISKTYGKRRTLVKALKNVNLTLKENEIVIIMGPSGSGKTTFLSIIGGLLHPTTGRVILDDIELNRLKEKDLAKIRLKKTGFIFQTFNLLESLTALENVEVPLNLMGIKGPEATKKAKDMLKIVGLEHRFHFYSNTLSSGEMQRVAIARALINDPEIILADEPTGNLDKKSGRKVMNLFKKLVKDKGKSAIIVTHDDRIIKIADRVLWLEDGVISSKKH